MEVLVFFLLLILGLLFYFIPALVAQNNNHTQTGAIFALNLFLGWTLLGWVVAFVWACSKSEPKEVIVQNTEPKLSVTDELTKFAELKEKGIITEEEFNKKKAQILGLE